MGSFTGLITQQNVSPKLTHSHAWVNAGLFKRKKGEQRGKDGKGVGKEKRKNWKEKKEGQKNQKENQEIVFLSW